MNMNICKYIITLVCLLGWAGVSAQDYQVQCEDTCSHVHGIDLSHYQGEVFWEAIGDNSKMAYVYLKATEGGDRIDDKYEQNIELAHKYGLKVGSYHFFRPKTPLKLQLENFKAQCRPSQQDLIPMIDVETKQGLSNDAFRDSLMTFLTMVEKAYHQKPLVYTGTNFYNRYMSGLMNGYKLMIAQYSSNFAFFSSWVVIMSLTRSSLSYPTIPRVADLASANTIIALPISPCEKP